MANPRILLVEDEADLAEPLVRGLEDEGFSVDWVQLGTEALHRVNNPYVLVILDLGLPDIKGTAVLVELQNRIDYPPVLVLTARGTIQDKIDLFQLGCDDYLTKPFLFEELIHRIRALLRRSTRVFKKKLEYFELQLDPQTHRLNSGASCVQLTPKESAMLELLIQRSETIVSKQEIIDLVWGRGNETDTNFVGVHLFNIRQKLKTVQKTDWLQTIRHSGFALCAPGRFISGSQD